MKIKIEPGKADQLVDNLKDYMLQSDVKHDTFRFGRSVFFLDIGKFEYKADTNLHRWSILVYMHNDIYLLVKRRLHKKKQHILSFYVKEAMWKHLGLPDEAAHVLSRNKADGKVVNKYLVRDNAFDTRDYKGYFFLGNGTYLMSNNGLSCLKSKTFDATLFDDDLELIKYTLTNMINEMDRKGKYIEFFEYPRLRDVLKKLNGVEIDSELMKGYDKKSWERGYHYFILKYLSGL